MERKIVLTSEETNKAKVFAEDLANKKFSFWASRDKTLTWQKAYENVYRGTCGEISVRNYLTANGYKLSKTNLQVHEEPTHDADLVVIGQGINIHVKTCAKNFCSWLFQHDAPYVVNPTARDFNCLVQQIDFDVYVIRSLGCSGDYTYEKTLKYMPTKVCINENTL